MKDNCKCFERALRNTIQNNESVWIFLFLCNYTSRKMSLISKLKSKVAGKHCMDADIPCGNGAALAWEDAKARPAGVHEAVGNNSGLSWKFWGQFHSVFQWRLDMNKKHKSSLASATFPTFPLSAVCKCCICPADCQMKIFGVQFIGPRRLIKIALVPKN